MSCIPELYVRQSYMKDVSQCAQSCCCDDSCPVDPFCDVGGFGNSVFNRLPGCAKHPTEWYSDLAKSYAEEEEDLFPDRKLYRIADPDIFFRAMRENGISLDILSKRFSSMRGLNHPESLPLWKVRFKLAGMCPMTADEMDTLASCLGLGCDLSEQTYPVDFVSRWHRLSGKCDAWDDV